MERGTGSRTHQRSKARRQAYGHTGCSARTGGTRLDVAQAREHRVRARVPRALQRRAGGAQGRGLRRSVQALRQPRQRIPLRVRRQQRHAPAGVAGLLAPGARLYSGVGYRCRV